MRRPLPILLLMALLNLCVSGSLWADDTEQTRAELERLGRELRELQQRLGRQQGESDALTQALGSAEQAIGRINQELRRISQQLQQHNQQLQALAKQRQELEAASKTQQQLVAKHLRAAWVLAGESPLKLMLNQEQPDTISRILRYHDYATRQRREAIEQYLQTLDNLQQVTEQTRATQIALTEDQQRLEQEQNALRGQQQQRQRTLDQLRQQIRSDQQRRTSLEEQRQTLSKLLEELEQAVARLALPSEYAPFVQQRGKLPWPLRGALLNAYGSPREGSLRWQGVRIKAAEGSDVQAIHHGRVVYADYLRGIGLLLILDHGDGYMSLYGHNQSLLREPGQWVRAGDVIATAGNSGGQTDSALYFELRAQGKPQDPVAWLRRR